MRVTLISGLSGSGKSIALRLLEDQGFFCVDNLPIALLPSLIDLYCQNTEVTKLGISVDVRSTREPETLLETLENIKHLVERIDILFLAANNEVLLKRFSETRRSHPLVNEEATLAEALKKERQLLEPIKEVAYNVDTSMMTAPALRYFVRQWLDLPAAPLYVVFESFGFKHGLPEDVDFVFDVRSLPNPFYVTHLRPFTGLDAPIQEFFAENDQVANMIDDIGGFLQKWLPNIEREMRSYITIGIGCTGGQHRSVYIAEALAARFGDCYQTLVRHRQLAQAQLEQSLHISCKD